MPGETVATRRIDFGFPSSHDSLGRNGRITTYGVEAYHFPGMLPGDRTCVCLTPVRKNGDPGRSQVTIDQEATGEVAAYLMLAFALHATPEARAAMVERMTTILETGEDPAFAEDGPAPGA